MKYKTTLLLLLLISMSFAWTENLWIASREAGTVVYVFNITTGTVVKSVDIGSSVIDIHVSNESNPVMSVLVKVGANFYIKTYDDDFSPLTTVSVGNTVFYDVWRMNSSFYFLLEDTKIRTVDGSGATLSSYTLSSGGYRDFTDYFVNAGDQLLSVVRNGTIPASSVVGMVYNITDGSERNITHTSAGSTKVECGFLRYNTTTQTMVWVVMDDKNSPAPQSRYTHATFNPATYEVLVNTTEFDLTEWGWKGYDHCWYSEKSDSFVMLNRSGELKEVGVSGERNRQFPDHNYHLIYEIPSGYTVTSGFVEEVGVSFDTYEFSAYCGINNPVPSITCSITDGNDIYSCQTALLGDGTIWINSTNYPVKTFSKVKNRTVPFTETLFNMTTRGGTGGWDAFMFYVFGGGIGHGGIPSEFNESWYRGAIVFDSPIDVDDIKDMIMWYNSTSEGFICSGGSSYRTEWYVGINSTHYLNRTSFCPNENYTVHDSYVQNTSLLINGSVVARIPLYKATDDTIRASVYEVTYWKANNPLSDVLIGSLTFVPPHLNISYEVSGRATCSVGDILSGEYTYTCNLNSSYESLDGKSFVSGSVTIEHGQNTTISIPMQRIIPLTLNITLYKGTERNPVPSINTKCTNQKGSEFSEFCTFDTKSYGCCEFIGVNINTDYNTEISPSGMNVTVFNVTFPISDYYNSDAVCSLWTGRCSRFTGNYRCLYNVESNLLLLNFSVKDCGSGQYIYGARVTYEDGRSCVTRQNGLCGFSEPVIKDFVVHNYTVSKRPFYEDKTFLFAHSPQVYPLLPCLERNASRNDINPEVAGGQEGDKDYSGVIGVMFDPMFVAVVFSFIIGGVVTFFSGSSSVGLVSIVGLFAMFTWFGFLPMWIGISIIIIGGLLAVNSVTNVFGGG